MPLLQIVITIDRRRSCAMALSRFDLNKERRLTAVSLLASSGYQLLQPSNFQARNRVTGATMRFHSGSDVHNHLSNRPSLRPQQIHLLGDVPTATEQATPVATELKPYFEPELLNPGCHDFRLEPVRRS
jgi:hypothetical protein